ncbi:ATP-binding protein [Clostridium sp. ZS2-4]|uniref:ATP-binding protein n=1 Tax=Clostridium sp. ZS2-4 TaxID=2987703 RepID=UPI00227B7CB8|nr:ATP-binding protein [Clostridium sp. ZS2-4]MCY6353643.1 ATP-binding protein [Clostridium sp. ZS2-4]
MELVVISGKGGTGKTTIAVALSELAHNVVKADCDVDAPNLYLMYKGEDIQGNDFITGKKAEINIDKCIKCGKCEEVCRFDAIKNYKINEYKCEGCTACSLVCPSGAVEIKDDIGAETLVTKAAKGIISRAKMEIGADGSGKLITEVRKNAKDYSKDNLVIIDGSPGIGCPVISSITGTDAALVVTEPTKSGLEDMKRVLEVCDYFRVKALVCINKSDINKEITKEIKSFCKEENYEVVGEIPYDDTVMKAINELKAITEYKESKVNLEIIRMWEKIKKFLYKKEEEF